MSHLAGAPSFRLLSGETDGSHRFPVGYQRRRRAMRDRDSELLNIPGVGPQTRQRKQGRAMLAFTLRLLPQFGSLRAIHEASAESLAAVVPRKTAEAIRRHFHPPQPAA